MAQVETIGTLEFEVRKVKCAVHMIQYAIFVSTVNLRQLLCQ